MKYKDRIISNLFSKLLIFSFFYFHTFYVNFGSETKQKSVFRTRIVYVFAEADVRMNITVQTCSK